MIRVRPGMLRTRNCAGRGTRSSPATMPEVMGSAGERIAGREQDLGGASRRYYRVQGLSVYDGISP